MSEKSKSTAAKKSTKSTASKSSTTKKAPTKKSTTAKKTTTSAAKKTPAKKSTTTTKKPATKSTTKKTTTKAPAKKVAKKATILKARIMSYRRSKRLQTTNQAIAQLLDDFNHKALVGRKFVLKFQDSDATASGVVLALHGQEKNKQLRIRFKGKGMSAHALNQIAEIQLK